VSERPDIDRLADTVARSLERLRFSNAQPALSLAWEANDARTALYGLVALARERDELEVQNDALRAEYENAENYILRSTHDAIAGREFARAEAAEERASRLEREREEFRGGWANEAGLTEQERARAERAEERASQLEHERDEDHAALAQGQEAFIAQGIELDNVNREATRYKAKLFEQYNETEQARREADQLRAALQQIASDADRMIPGRWKQIARAALAGVQAKEQA